MCRLRDLRSGELVGTDKAGNKYFQNDNYFFGKNHILLIIARHVYMRIIHILSLIRDPIALI